MGPLLTTDYSPPTFFSEPGDRRDVFQYVSLRVLTLLHSKNGRNWAMAHKRSGNIPSVPGIRVFRGFTEKAAAGHSSDSRGAKRTANIEIARTAKFSAEDRHNPHPWITKHQGLRHPRVSHRAKRDPPAGKVKAPGAQSAPGAPSVVIWVAFRGQTLISDIKTYFSTQGRTVASIYLQL